MLGSFTGSLRRFLGKHGKSSGSNYQKRTPSYSYVIGCSKQGVSRLRRKGAVNMLCNVLRISGSECWTAISEGGSTLYRFTAILRRHMVPIRWSVVGKMLSESLSQTVHRIASSIATIVASTSFHRIGGENPTAAAYLSLFIILDQRIAFKALHPMAVMLLQGELSHFTLLNGTCFLRWTCARHW